MAACVQAESMLGDALRELEAVTQERFALHDRLLSCEAVPPYCLFKRPCFICP